MMRHLFTTAFVLLAAALPAGADEIEWTNAVSGDFVDAGNWTVTSGIGSPPPGVGDIVNFNESIMVGAYMITLTQNEASDVLNVTAGDVTLLSDDATVRTYALTTGDGDINVNGGVLTVGLTAGMNNFPVFVDADGILFVGVSANGTLNVQGAAWAATAH